MYDYFQKICGTYVLFVLNSHTHASILPHLMFCHFYIYIYISSNSQKTFFFRSVGQQWAAGLWISWADHVPGGSSLGCGWFCVNRLGVENAKSIINMRNEEVHPICLEVWCHVAKQLHAVYIFIKENVWRLCSGRLVINGSRNIQKVKIAFIFGNLVPVWIIFRQKRVLYQTTQFDGVGRAKQIRSTSSPS